MDKPNDGGPAFPIIEPHHPVPIVITGMSLRDYFAAKALSSLLLNQGYLESVSPAIEAAAKEDEVAFADLDPAKLWRRIVAREAYDMADAMLAAREVADAQ